MCAAQSNPTSFSGYTWSTDPVVEITPNINYTVSSDSMPYLQLTDAGSVTVQKDIKGAITNSKGGIVRRMYVLNEPFTQATSTQNNIRVITTAGAGLSTKKQDVLSMTNGILDTKTQTVLTTGNKTFMTPLGTLQLTAEEYNEILMKRAVAAAQQQQAPQTITSDHDLSGLQVQVQKVIQGLEEGDDSQATSSTHCKLEPVLDIEPKEEPDTENGRPTKERPYSCQECGKSFLLKHHLTTHARVHTGERPHVCVHCSKSFAHKHCLNTHLLLHSTDRPYQCTECRKSFTLKHHLLTHSRVHSRERPFVCQECGKSFPLKRHLVTHSKYHAGERPYVCEECGESFAQENHLVMHSRFHGSVNPFVCSDCGATFPRKFQLVNHGRIHGRVPHSCTICGKEFLQKRTLVSHMRIHTGDQPYPCTACGEGFRTKAELNQHNRLQHGGINPNSSNTTVVAANTIVSTSAPQTHQVVVQQSPQQQQQHTVTVTNANNLVTTVSAQGNETGTTATLAYRCRECGHVFNTREALALHLRLHTGDRSLMTDLCALTAAIPQHILSAANINQGTVITTNQVNNSPVPVQLITSSGNIVSLQSQPQQIQQQQVQQQVQQPQQQQQQQTLVHAISQQQKPKSHFCASCGRGFASKHGLINHNRRHPDGGCTLRSHVCECGKAFFQKNHLMLHQRQHMDTKPQLNAQQQEIANQAQNQNQQQQNQQQQQQNQQQQTQQQQQQANNSQTREVLIGNTPVHVQVLQGNTPQLIKYEINIPQDGNNSIE